MHPSQGVPRADIVQLLRAGYGNVHISLELGCSRPRVARIRAEEDLPPVARKTGRSLEEKWTANARPTTGGHMRWAGFRRDGTPALTHQQRKHSARRIGFQIGHGRKPIGRVLPGCGRAWCIAPEHATDEPMRRANALRTGLFGRAA
jgi:hypothetical protein